MTSNEPVRPTYICQLRLKELSSSPLAMTAARELGVVSRMRAAIVNTSVGNEAFQGTRTRSSTPSNIK